MRLESHGGLGQAIADLAAAIDSSVVGQDDAKKGLLLALIAGQHAYLEGPPGCGKSQLAWSAALAAAPQPCLLVFHRDLREADLLGDIILKRAREGDGERLRFETRPGPLLESTIAVLEDLPRAPGQALGPLLRILSERRVGSRTLPLKTAIATAPLESSDATLDPLEPSQLDRFAVQVRMTSLIGQRSWFLAHQVVARAARGEDRPSSPSPGRSRLNLARLGQATAELPILEATLVAYRRLLERLQQQAQRLSPQSSQALLSDRTFGQAVFPILRAHALIDRRSAVEPQDLRALRLMIAKRIPPELEPAFEELIEEASAEPKEQSHHSAAAMAMAMPAAGLETSGEEDPERNQNEVSGTAALELPEIGEPPMPARASAVGVETADVERLMRVLTGRLEKGRRERDDDPGGAPRRYQPLRQFDELLDCDPLEATLFAEGRLPGRPRALRRSRRNAGGALVVLRDVSSSMAGERNAWAGRVTRSLVDAAAHQRARIAYIEFHHRALPRETGGRLLSRRYRQVREQATVAQPLGQTSYEEPLRLALETLRGRRGHNRHIVMLTDGLPITGDTQVRRERALARRLGVSVHTVFIGDGDVPTVLDEISRETGGLRFQAIESGRGLAVVERR